MKEKCSAFFMWLAAIPVTGAGIRAMVDSWVRGASAVIGFLTALLGLLIAVMGLIWWRRRLHHQSIKIQMEELELRRMQERVNRTHHPK